MFGSAVTDCVPVDYAIAEKLRFIFLTGVSQPRSFENNSVVSIGITRYLVES